MAISQFLITLILVIGVCSLVGPWSGVREIVKGLIEMLRRY